MKQVRKPGLMRPGGTFNGTSGFRACDLILASLRPGDASRRPGTITELSEVPT
ncbi:hypothetical protein LJ655_02705 [Paraburkholderia sp. MMS20-SJTN17]|uniref:Uncharacterized protein n=1 Tax=Paraburkholderia translucens TaxID=2886945 RepID=A0ABS8K7U3_9BURK|nr:hypothetical protein [Paraburkholderia sp. MMS20-SJTN17]MCC8400816.1 hypothetical protein [Paraburkholderia sp. MMS20-SJTN17]